MGPNPLLRVQLEHLQPHPYQKELDDTKNLSNLTQSLMLLVQTDAELHCIVYVEMASAKSYVRETFRA